MEWTDYFLGVAFLVSQRSKDAQTKHGCVLVDRYNRVVGCGYNSFARGMPDKDLPNTRPLKYPLMLHAEKNAILNCTVDLRNAGATAYVTGMPCFSCAYDLWQAGVERIVYAARSDWSWHATSDEEINFDILKKNLQVIPHAPNLSFLSNVVEIAQQNNWIQPCP